MKNKNFKNFPLEFHKINKLARDKKKASTKNNHIQATFYQSNEVIPKIFFKPISKIVNFDF